MLLDIAQELWCRPGGFTESCFVHIQKKVCASLDEPQINHPVGMGCHASPPASTSRFLWYLGSELKVEVALKPCLSLYWWCTPPRGLAMWAGMLELVWDPSTSVGCGELVHIQTPAAGSRGVHSSRQDPARAPQGSCSISSSLQCCHLPGISAH